MKQVSGDVKTFAIFLAGFRKKKKNPFKQIRTGNVIFVHFRGKEVYQVQGYRTSLSPLDNKIFFYFCH